MGDAMLADDLVPLLMLGGDAGRNTRQIFNVNFLQIQLFYMLC